MNAQSEATERAPLAPCFVAGDAPIDVAWDEARYYSPDQRAHRVIIDAKLGAYVTDRQRARIEAVWFELVPVDVSELLKAGGSVTCATLELHTPLTAVGDAPFEAVRMRRFGTSRTRTTLGEPRLQVGSGAGPEPTS